MAEDGNFIMDIFFYLFWRIINLLSMSIWIPIDYCHDYIRGKGLWHFWKLLPVHIYHFILILILEIGFLFVLVVMTALFILTLPFWLPVLIYNAGKDNLSMRFWRFRWKN